MPQESCAYGRANCRCYRARTRSSHPPETRKATKLRILEGSQRGSEGGENAGRKRCGLGAVRGGKKRFQAKPPATPGLNTRPGEIPAADSGATGTFEFSRRTL